MGIKELARTIRASNGRVREMTDRLQQVTGTTGMTEQLYRAADQIDRLARLIEEKTEERDVP